MATNERQKTIEARLRSEVQELLQRAIDRLDPVKTPLRCGEFTENVLYGESTQVKRAYEAMMFEQVTSILNETEGLVRATRSSYVDSDDFDGFWMNARSRASKLLARAIMITR